MAKVDNFEVLREMASKNMDIAMAPLSQIARMNKTRAGCEITIGAPMEMMTKIAIGRCGGGLGAGATVEEAIEALRAQEVQG